MDTIPIYRVEDKNGIGMYARSGGFTEVRYKYDEDDLNSYVYHPTPTDDPMMAAQWSKINQHYYRNSPYYFGFYSIGQLLSWICRDVWLEQLHVRGYVCSIYLSDDYIIGDTQAAFHRAKSKLDKQFSLLTLVGHTGEMNDYEVLGPVS